MDLVSGQPAAARSFSYCDPELDRSTDRRTDAEWVARLVTVGNPVVLALWRDRCLLRSGSDPLVVQGASARELIAHADQAVLLGLSENEGVFAVDLTSVDEAEALRRSGARASAEVRDLYGELSAPQAARLAYARGLLYWHRHTRFCGACGHSTIAATSGHTRSCPNESSCRGGAAAA